MTPKIDGKLACFGMRLAKSKIHRWGVYATENIPANRKVIEYTGELISRRETKRRIDAQSRLMYLFTLDKYWTIDGAAGGSGAEYINHCCEPNLFSRIVRRHILYMSNRSIPAGEELTIDYRFAAEVDAVKCHCGAAGCRGTINLPADVAS